MYNKLFTGYSAVLIEWNLIPGLEQFINADVHSGRKCVKVICLQLNQ